MDYEKLLTNLGPLGLTFALVIALGYVIRLIPVIQNKFIPLLAPVAGAGLLPLIAPAGYVGEAWKNPTVVLAIYGFIVGVAAWAAHAIIISRIEDLIASKVPAVDKLLKATSDKAPVWLLAGLLALGTTACIPPSRIAPGADPVVVQAEQLAKNATDTIDAFLQWEFRNHEAVHSDVRAAADLAREYGPTYIRQLRTATKTYKTVRNPDNLNDVNAAIASLQQLLDQIREHYTKAQTP